MNKSQIETTKILRDFILNINKPITVETLIGIRDKIYAHIETKPYNESTKEHEKSIRWKRTASQILEDNYVYEGKACTDLSILFIALCAIFNLETRFVKLKKDTQTHSIVEIKLDDGWYMFDISNKTNIPYKGEVTKTNSYKGWQLWRKGRDAWDLGLVNFDSMKRIKI